MKGTDDFAGQIESRLSSIEQEIHRRQEKAEQHMAALAERLGAYGRLVARLMPECVRPRMERLASYFDNAELSEADRKPQCEIQFRHSPRFPATVALRLSLEHDEDCQELTVAYNVEILPVFLQYERHDEVSFPLDAVDEGELAEWIEGKLLAFLDTYLRLETVDQYQQENLVTDPVCHMRITKLTAVAHLDFGGHRFYFCSTICRDKFAAAAGKYVKTPG